MIDLLEVLIWLQIRSHAQKYFLKVQKNGTNEHLPPPRPKRKAGHPYPQKASKNGKSKTDWPRGILVDIRRLWLILIYVCFVAHVPAQAPGSFPSSSALLKSGYVLQPDSSSILRTPVNNAKLASQTNNTVPTINLPHTKGAVSLNCLLTDKVNVLCWLCW